MDVTIKHIQHRSSINLNKKNWDRYKLSKIQLPTTAKNEKRSCVPSFLKQASHHKPSGQHRLDTELVPTEILEKMRARDDLRSRDSTSPALPEMNDENTRITNEHKEKSGDILWRRWTIRHILQSCGETIKAIDGKSTPKAENEAITFKYRPQSRLSTISTDSSPLQSLAHTSSRETRLVSVVVVVVVCHDQVRLQVSPGFRCRDS